MGTRRERRTQKQAATVGTFYFAATEANTYRLWVASDFSELNPLLDNLSLHGKHDMSTEHYQGWEFDSGSQEVVDGDGFVYQARNYEIALLALKSMGCTLLSPKEAQRLV